MCTTVAHCARLEYVFLSAHYPTSFIRSMKNVSLIETQKDGKRSWRLLDPAGQPIASFDAFAISLLKKHSVNTRISYCRHLAEFFDFLYEAADSLSKKGAAGFDRDILAKVIEAYDDYLVLGKDADSAIAQSVNETMPSPCVSNQSSAIKHAPVRKFLRLSERVRRQMFELTTAGVKSFDATGLPLFPRVGEHKAISGYQRAAMVGNSLLASVISRGPKLLEEDILPNSTPDITYDHSRAFPFDKVATLINNLTTYRDKALYSFCAASGCRISEALQLLWEDIDTKFQTVRLIDPKSRPHSASYKVLAPLERERLVWKGRATTTTLLIEPFASMFFDSLAAYLKSEYVPHGKHQFVFQYSTGGQRGVPYFLCAASSRNGVLKRAIKLSGVKGVEGPHSLRHMYGTYLLNYFPRPDRTYGLPMGIVQKLMGHKTQRATEKYARHDWDLIETELRYANLIVFEHGEAKSLIQLKREALLAKLEAVERELSGTSKKQSSESK